jgi:opacity protein-like surface antigen
MSTEAAGTRRRRGVATIAGLGLAAMLVPVDAPAQELHGSVTLYGWLPWLELEATSRAGVTTETSVGAADVLDALNLAFMAAGEVHYGRFGLLQDFVYADLGSGGTLSGPLASGVGIDTNMLLSTTALSYRAFDEQGWLLEPYAGLRYVDIETDVRIIGGGPLGLSAAAAVELSWWDPVIGLRARAPVTQRLSAGGFVDIGGFGAGSEFSWEIYAGLDYAVTDHLSAVGGFRYLSIDYEDDGAELKLDTYGPVLGATLRF